ncbi:MAG: recombinase family protein [Lachnospiraceae bacterium]|nr:recombinase family protein [Lachnospiraceae bacterium]
MDQQKITILYCRLSNEDALDGESNSIQNQRELLTRYANEHGYSNLKILVDDGYTGTNFNRPGVQEGIELVKQGLVGAWIVKDMSRFGRDYLQVGQYTELVFPSYDVRFIAINDGVDSSKGDDDFTPFRNLFNDFYAKDTSKKVKAILRARGTSGKHMNRAPYGYREDPERRGYWLIDEEAAAVVKHIFDLYLDGKSPTRIARILEQEHTLTVRAYQAQKKGNPLPAEPYGWAHQSVVDILRRMEYSGCTCNFKTYSRSYKLKKRIPNKPEDMFIIPDTQEAIVSKEQWDRAQELLENRRRMTKGVRHGFFSGLLYCADCGSKLHFCTCKRYDGEQDRYVCARYKSNRGDCSAHYIREAVLRELVLERIQAVNAYIRDDAEGFQEEWMQCQRDAQERSIREGKKQIAKAKKRLADIDTLIIRIYEDSVLGNLSQERYKKMAESYEAEQEQLQLEIGVMEDWVDTQENQKNSYDQFKALTEKYVDVTELTQTIVNEYIKKIIVYAPERSDGKRQQKIKIIFNFVEEVDIPSVNGPIIYEQSNNSKKTA